MSDETNTDTRPLPRKGAWLAMGAVAGVLAALGAVLFVAPSDWSGQPGDPDVLTPASEGRPLVSTERANAPPAQDSRDGSTSPAPTPEAEAPVVGDPLAEAALQRLLERREAEEARLAERARLASESPLTPGARALTEMVVAPPDETEAPDAVIGTGVGPEMNPAMTPGQTATVNAGLNPGRTLAPSGLTADLAVPSGGSSPRQAAVPPHVSAHVLARGAVIPTVLESAIDSDLPGLVRARVSADVYDSVTGAHVLIPRGSALVGAYAQSGGAGQQRLFVTWTDLRLPDGTPVGLEDFSALGADGAAGLRGRRSTGFLKALGAAVLFDLAGNATQILTGDGPQQQSGDIGALIAAATGNATSRVAERYLEQVLQGGTRFRVAAGTIMNVLVEEDMSLPAQGRGR